VPARRASSADRRPRPGASPAAEPGQVDRTADRIHSAAIHLLRRLRREDDRSGLSAPRLSALSVLVFGGRALTLGELAAAEQVRPPTMTRLVAALEADGLVVREADRTDGRLTRVRPTAKGRSLLARGRARRVAALTAQVRALDARDRDALAAAVTILERVIARLR